MINQYPLRYVPTFLRRCAQLVGNNYFLVFHTIDVANHITLEWCDVWRLRDREEGKIDLFHGILMGGDEMVGCSLLEAP